MTDCLGVVFEVVVASEVIVFVKYLKWWYYCVMVGHVGESIAFLCCFLVVVVVVMAVLSALGVVLGIKGCWFQHLGVKW